VSDMHTGSNKALFLSDVWHGKHMSHHIRSDQERIRSHFEKFAELVRERRKGKRLELIHNGDAIDGDHHHSGDVCTLDMREQADLHISIMAWFQKKIGWKAGDMLYYTRGTHIHVTDQEDYIGTELNAVMDGDKYAWELLRLKTNDTLSWFYHTGPKKGKGANRGNGLRNWLKNIYFEALEDGREYPNIVYTGHVHDPDFSTYTVRSKGFTWSEMQAIILPSWQMKTAYAWEKVPASVNRIGGVVHEIKADGTICVPEFCVMVSE